MDNSEVKSELMMTYNNLVDYLLDKYGPAQYNYFSTNTCKTRNAKVSRASEGLVCHHIDEDKAIRLSTPSYAARNPFEYQLASRLVYCNALEHLLLHVKIVEEPLHIEANILESPGIGGAVRFICPEINDYYNGYEFKQEYKKRMYSLIENNFAEYIGILIYMLSKVKTVKPQYSYLLTKEVLARGTDGKIVSRVYDKL